MILYHGGVEPVEKPEIRAQKENRYLDFGSGFYTTSSYEQAERWARIKTRRDSKDSGCVSVYDFDFDALKESCEVKYFEKADFDWLNFVVANRRGEGTKNATDLYIGPVADDNVYQSIRLFETGIFDAEYTVKKLKTEILHDQWMFHTAKSLEYLKFIESHKIK